MIYTFKFFKFFFENLNNYQRIVAIINPTPIQSTKTAHRKNVKNAEIDNPRAKAKRTLEPKSENAKRTRKAGSSRAH